MMRGTGNECNKRQDVAKMATSEGTTSEGKSEDISDQELLELLIQDDTDDYNPELNDDELQENDTEKKNYFLRTNISKLSFRMLLDRLSHPESNIMENERSLAEKLNKISFEESHKEFLDAIAEMFAQCYELKARKKNKRLRAIEIEKKFYEKRTNCSFVHNAWINVLTSANLEKSNDTDNVLQHILQHFWSTIGSTTEMTDFEITSLPLKIPDEMESFAIKDHAGWAIKRARDIVKSSSVDQLKIKQSPKDNVILVVDKDQALKLIAQLGKDVKQADGHYRFIPNDDVCNFFLLLHDAVESLLSKSNIFSQGSKVVIMCLQCLATNKQMVTGRFADVPVRRRPVRRHSGRFADVV